MWKYKTKIVITSAYTQYIHIIRGVEGFKNVLSWYTLVIQEYHITSTLTYPNKSSDIEIYIYSENFVSRYIFIVKQWFTNLFVI